MPLPPTLPFDFSVPLYPPCPQAQCFLTVVFRRRSHKSITFPKYAPPGEDRRLLSRVSVIVLSNLKSVMKSTYGTRSTTSGKGGTTKKSTYSKGTVAKATSNRRSSAVGASTAAKVVKTRKAPRFPRSKPNSTNTPAAIEPAHTTPYNISGVFAKLAEILESDVDTTTFTFGVEMELTITVDPEDYMAKLKMHKDKPRAIKALSTWTQDGKHQSLVFQSIANTLTTAGYPVNKVDIRKDLGDLDKWTVGGERTIHTSADNTAANGATATVGFELVTPKLPFNATSLTKLYKVITLLDWKHNISTNNDCSLHVHVGLTNRAGQVPYDLPTLRALALLHLVFPSQVNTIHPPHYVARSNPLSAAFTRFTPSTLPANIARLLACKSKKAFLNTVGTSIDDRAYSVNFQNTRAAARFGTVEFRQHAGCFDVGEVLHWVQVVVGMVKWARTADLQECEGLAGMARTAWREVVGTTALFAYLGLAEEVVEFYGGRLFDHADTVWVEPPLDDEVVANATAQSLHSTRSRTARDPSLLAAAEEDGDPGPSRPRRERAGRSSRSGS